tara:strand:- start:2060 stop:2638 length:579 start_codon:yes stop_codon:yes gene_type:complete
MTKEIDFYFDFISPYAYLAHKKNKSLSKNIKINYKPILLGGLHNLNGIKAPAFIKHKLKHMISDCKMIAKENKFTFSWNSKFPLNSLYIMRGYIYVSFVVKNIYIDAMFDAYWKDDLDISNEKIFNNILEKCKIKKNTFLQGINSQKVKDELKNATKEAHDKEIFGAPTYVVNNKIFWGQDRLEFALNEFNK